MASRRPARLARRLTLVFLTISLPAWANTASQVGARGFHSCALTTAGGVRCWGTNFAGNLGDGTSTDHASPVDVVGLESGVAAVTLGQLHTCALTTAGGVKCWGSYDTVHNSPTPVDVTGLGGGVTAIAAG